MKDWNADKILAVGMVVAFLAIVLGVDVVAVRSGDMTIASLGKEIAIGLFGYMGRGAVQSVTSKPQEQQSQTAQTLGKVSEVAAQGQTIANAIDAMQDALKPKK